MIISYFLSSGNFEFTSKPWVQFKFVHVHDQLLIKCHTSKNASVQLQVFEVSEWENARKYLGSRLTVYGNEFKLDIRQVDAIQYRCIATNKEPLESQTVCLHLGSLIVSPGKCSACEAFH